MTYESNVYSTSLQVNVDMQWFGTISLDHNHLKGSLSSWTNGLIHRVLIKVCGLGPSVCSSHKLAVLLLVWEPYSESHGISEVSIKNYVFQLQLLWTHNQSCFIQLILKVGLNCMGPLINGNSFCTADMFSLMIFFGFIIRTQYIMHIQNVYYLFILSRSLLVSRVFIKVLGSQVICGVLTGGNLWTQLCTFSPNYFAMCILTKLFRNVYPHQIILKRVSEILLVNMSIFAWSIRTLLFLLFMVVYKKAVFLWVCSSILWLGWIHSRRLFVFVNYLGYSTSIIMDNSKGYFFQRPTKG